jgi:dTDP-4-amino-4,6-dideoxygalactose transaminase
MLAANYRMTNIQASILLSQIKILDEILNKKNKILEFYKNKLSSNFIFQKNEEGTSHSKWMVAVRLKEFDYNKEIKDKNLGFETRPMFYPMSYHKHLKKFSNIDEEINASTLQKEVFMIPSHPGLKEKDLKKIVDTLNDLVGA